MIVPIKYRLRKFIIAEILKSLSFRKLIIIIYSWISYVLRRNRSASTPYILILHLTYDCNFSCIMCQKSSLDTTVYSSNPIHMDFDRLFQLLKENSKNIVFVKLHGGEPLLYKNIIKLICLLNDLNIKFTLITNGSLLTEEICNLLLKNCIEIEISIDSADKELYKNIRKGGDLLLLEDNIRLLNEIKEKSNSKTPFLRTVVTVFSFNISGLRGMVDFSSRHKINEIAVLEGSFYNTPYIKDENFINNDLEFVKKTVIEISEHARRNGVLVNFKSPIFKLDKNEGQSSSRKLKFKNCFYHYSSIDISPNFEVALCTVSEYVDILNNKSIKDVWNSKNSKIVKNRKLLNKNEYPATCRYCKQYCMNNYDSYIDYQKSNHYWKVTGDT